MNFHRIQALPHGKFTKKTMPTERMKDATLPINLEPRIVSRTLPNKHQLLISLQGIGNQFSTSLQGQVPGRMSISCITTSFYQNRHRCGLHNLTKYQSKSNKRNLEFQGIQGNLPPECAVKFLAAVFFILRGVVEADVEEITTSKSRHYGLSKGLRLQDCSLHHIT